MTLVAAPPLYREPRGQLEAEPQDTLDLALDTPTVANRASRSYGDGGELSGTQFMSLCAQNLRSRPCKVAGRRPRVEGDGPVTLMSRTLPRGRLAEQQSNGLAQYQHPSPTNLKDKRERRPVPVLMCAVSSPSKHILWTQNKS